MDQAAKKQNLVKCKNKLCALYNEDYKLHCSAENLGITNLMDIRNCNVRELYHKFVKEDVHSKWLSNHRDLWNLYQKAYRNSKKKEIVQNG